MLDVVAVGLVRRVRVVRHGVTAVIRVIGGVVVRVFGVLCGGAHGRPRSGRDQVDEGEDDDPHDVDEVPVETDQLDDLGLVAGDAAARDDADQGHQHDDADGDVHTVEAGEGVEARAEQAGGEAEALAVEGW